ncbi:MAG: hypothetical protein CL868_15395 [Cytophagaceae bacterium]|nr:hypothetical protein [Cytophagaceae bacterium]
MTGCAKDDDIADNEEANFYSGALRDASREDLLKSWAIFEVEYNGTKSIVPQNYSACGRDFFQFDENGSYKEYLFQDYECNFYFNTLDWQLNEGVITLSNGSSTDEMVITKLTSGEFVFKSRLDLDEDGVLDVFKLYARAYEPDVLDNVTDTFSQVYDNPTVTYGWMQYRGVAGFDRYEIYRTTSPDCGEQGEELIKTITDVGQTTFTDENPPNSINLCYSIKVYTREGLLGSSAYRPLDTNFMEPAPVTLLEPVVSGNTIHLSWEQSTYPFFSHYEITYTNFPSNTTGYGMQEITVAIIDDRGQTTFVDENPPYLANPYYRIYVHDIYGKRSRAFYEDVTTSRKIPYMRDAILPVQSIRFFDVDPGAPVVYLFGKPMEEDYVNNKIYRYNYATSTVEATSTEDLNISASVPMKLIESNYGKELFMMQSGLKVYDPVTLRLKYNLELDTYISINDYVYLGNELWFLTDGDEGFVFKRNENALVLVDRGVHFIQHQGSGDYKAYVLSEHKVIIGHPNEEESRLFTLDDNGNILNIEEKNISLQTNASHAILTSREAGILVNTKNRDIYNAVPQYIDSYQTPLFSTGLSRDGMKILGHDNDPEGDIGENSSYTKETILYDRGDGTAEKVNMIGYPHILFEDYTGNLMSLSTGLKKNHISQGIQGKADFFIEKVGS